MVTRIYPGYAHMVLVTLALWHNKFIPPFRQALEILCYGEHHPLYHKYSYGHNSCVFLMTSVHKWICLGSHCWVAVLHPAVAYKLQEKLLTNQVSHPRAWVPPLLFALGICCPWGVFLFIWLCLHLCLGLEKHSRLEMCTMVISPWPVLAGAAEQFWSTLVEHWPGQGKCASPWAGSGDLTQWCLPGTASSQKIWASLVQMTLGTKLSLGWSKLCTLFLWGPEFVGTWVWICSFHSLHAVWLFDVNRASLSVNGLCFHAVFL